MNFKKGDIILVKFPYQDLSKSKIRPALVIATIEGNNVILSQITTKTNKKYSVEIKNSLLNSISYIRLDFIMTLDYNFCLKKIEKFTNKELNEFNMKFKEVFEI